MIVKMIENPEERHAIARDVLDDLPEWFGIPESKEEYIRESGEMPFFAAVEGMEIIGFMAMKETSPLHMRNLCNRRKKALPPQRCGKRDVCRL